MFGIGEGELLIILGFAFMIFGPDKLPGMGRTIGRALRQFREAQEGFTQVVQTEVMDPLQDAMGDSLDTGDRAKRRAAAEERAAALAQDADLDDDAVADKAPRAETFAERKARLAAEREAQAAAQAAADEPVAEGDVAQAAPVEDAAEQKAPDTSAAALYALGGRSSFAAAKEEAAAAAAEAAAEPEPEPEVADAAPEQDALSEGKEDGNAEA